MAILNKEHIYELICLTEMKEMKYCISYFQKFSLSQYFYCHMQVDPLQISAQISADNSGKGQDMMGSSLQVKVKQDKKKLIVSDLNLNNPQDKALSLCLKMVEMRKKRQEKQNKLIEEIRKSRVLDYTVGRVPQAIARDHFIARHEYLRQTQYRIDKPKIVINRAMAGSQLVGEQKKKALQREIEILQKSKLSTHRYEVKRMVQEILDDAIDHSIIMHERKKKFYFKGFKASESKLQNEWQRRARGKKGSLSLSRVLDLKMVPSDQSEDQSQNEDDEQKTENDLEKPDSQNQEQSPQESQAQQEALSSKSEEQKQEDVREENAKEEDGQSDHA